MTLDTLAPSAREGAKKMQNDVQVQVELSNGTPSVCLCGSGDEFTYPVLSRKFASKRAATREFNRRERDLRLMTKKHFIALHCIGCSDCASIRM